MLSFDADTDLAQRLLDGLAGRTDDLQLGLYEVAEELRERNAETFSTRGHGRWSPLDMATVKRKNGDRRVLVDKGGLLKSLTIRRAHGSIERVKKDSVYVGTKNPVATLHRRGTKKMPARNPIPKVTRREREEYAGILLDFVIGDER